VHLLTELGQPARNRRAARLDGAKAGKPVFLRGICIHEENPMRGGRVYSVGDARMLLGWAKEINANFVRLAHYPTTSTWPAWPTSWAYWNDRV
jgi:hypothetical protein